MKIGIVGTGFVGAAAAYALILRGIGSEIVLVDKNAARAAAEADDLFHAVPFAGSLDVRAGSYADLSGSHVIVIAAGVGQRPGETRLQLLERNAAVFGEVIPAILNAEPNAVLLVATNPVDVMTHLTARLAAMHGVPGSRVLGTGTTLDSARFRTLLGRHLKVDPHHIHAYVVGEHGDSEVLTWSLATVAGSRLDQFCAARSITLSDADRVQIDDRVRRAAYHIIRGKGATYYGIGAAIARIVEVILQDQQGVLTVCTHTPEIAGVRDITLSLPRVVGRQGVVATIPLLLDAAEQAALQRSAEVIRGAIDSIPLPAA